MNYFEWVTEGLLIFIVGIIGLFGNGVSVWTFWRQRVHRIFHNLLLILAIFDMIYVACSIHLFSLAKFWPSYDQLARTPTLPYVIPIAQIGLMGSVYCTVALAIERFLAVYYPFLPRKQVYSTKTFVIPVICFSILYNISKFFELDVIEEKTLTLPNGTMLYASTLNNETLDQYDEASMNVTYILQPTKLRLDSMYITIYILWMNLIFNILGPFLLLATLNHIVYKKIKEFETRLTEGLGICLTANSRRHRNPDNDNGGANGSQHHLHAPITANRSLRHSRTLSASDENESRGVGGTGRRNHASGDPDRIVRIDSSERVELNGRGGGRMSNKRKSKKHASTPRRREVLLSKISIYIVYMFVSCHSVKLIPNIYELIWTYTRENEREEMPWPPWVAKTTNVSHFLLTLVCSSNFFIYYFKHGSLCKSRRKAAANRAKIQTELGSPAMHQQTGTTTLMNMTIETSNSASTRPELLRLSTRLHGGTTISSVAQRRRIRRSTNPDPQSTTQF